MGAMNAPKRAPRILLRSSWQTVNIGDIAHTPGVLRLLEKHLPGVGAHPMRPQFEDMTLAQVMPLSQGMITQATIDAIAADIAALPAR